MNLGSHRERSQEKSIFHRYPEAWLSQVCPTPRPAPSLHRTNSPAFSECEAPHLNSSCHQPCSIPRLIACSILFILFFIL